MELKKRLKTLCLAFCLFTGVGLVAQECTIVIKSASSVLIETERQAPPEGAKSEEEIYQSRNQLDLAEKMLKRFLPLLIPADGEGDAVTMKLGTNTLGEQYQLPKLETEEFIIHFPDSKTIVIVGGSQLGARNGVVEFLQRYAGMRWLFPGEAGLHVPQQPELRIPMKQLRDKPFFAFRALSWPYPVEERYDQNNSGWKSFNRQNQSMLFSHNLHKLLPREKYAKTHPEFYPKRVNGKLNDSWNLILNAPGLTEEAIRQICNTFRRSPSQRSYSLGMNDFSRFEGTEADGTNSVGLSNYSDYYYGWVNKIIEGVTKEFPDKLFGMIAYSTVTDPPSFRLHPQAVPIICIDRMRWFDEYARKKDMKRTLDWAAKSSRLGWYDYIYGDQNYLVPRMYLHLMDKYLKWAAANGVTYYYAESYSTTLPVEGPKNWLVMQLLWNPQADAEALLNEWYTLAVGPKAAPHLRNYFDFWEKFWSQKVAGSDWFKRYYDWVYFDFLDHNYMQAFNLDDLPYCDNEIKQVVEKAGSPAEKRRAELFRQAWQATRENILYAMTFHHPTKGGSEYRIFQNDFNQADSLKNDKDPIPNGWIFWQSFPGEAKGEWNGSGGLHGSGALVVHLDKASTAVFARAFKPEPDKIYRFRCQIQAEQVGDKGRIYVGVNWRNHKNVINHKYGLNYFCGTEVRDGKWHQIEIQFRQPPLKDATLNLLVGTKGVKQGILRVDAAELAVVAAP